MEIGKIITIVLLGLCLLGMAFCAYMLIKNNNTFDKRCIILNLISKYRADILDNTFNWLETKPSDCKVDYDDMEPYDKTLNRLWDWGYKRILPKEKFDILMKHFEEKEGGKQNG